MPRENIASSREITVTVGVTSGRVLAANDRRRGIIWFPSPVASVVISTSNPALTTSGVILISGMPPWHMCLYEHGRIVQDDWFAVSIGAATVIGIIEILE